MSKEKNKIATSIFWQGLERVGSYGIGFVVSVILANKLPVEDFGIVTIMTVFITLSNVFIDSGFSTALIQKKDMEDADCCSVFYINIVMSLILYAVLFLASPLIETFYEADGLTKYLHVFSLTLIILFMLILPVAYWAHEDSKIHDAAKERMTQLELDYSQILWKLTMLLSAGLTIRGAFTKIADQYVAEHAAQGSGIGEHSPKYSGQTDRKTAKKSQKSQKSAARRYVYEEMILTLREMRSGVPEASAYENFGRRCGLPSYIKLGSLLSQNLKKGSKGLTALLEHEAVLSMDQHKMAVRKLGERASVKMLLPMILMFGVVLIILMVPAFLSM